MAAAGETAQAILPASPFDPAVRDCMASPMAGHGVSGAAGAGLQALRVAARAFDMIRLTDMDSGIFLSGPQAVSAPVPGTLAVHTAAPVGMNLDTGL